jgi:hypothetical protein
MPNTDLRAITDFESLRDFLEDELDWNLSGYSFDNLTFSYAAEELGLKPEEAAGVKAIHQLRPLSGRQPWGIFFVEFELKRLTLSSHRRHRPQSNIQHLLQEPQRLRYPVAAFATPPK